MATELHRRLMALALEGSRLVKSRLDLSQSDFNRVSDLCTLIFLVMFIYLFVSKRSYSATLDLFQWAPLALLPLVLAQAYSTSDRIDLNALFLIFRRKEGGKERGKPLAINIT